MSSEAYEIKPCPRDPKLYDVVRKTPAVIAVELRKDEAIALARDLNAQINRMENPT